MWTTDWLYTIVNTSVIASVMALVILLVRTVFRRSLPKKALFMLWMLVLVKLIIPFQLPSPVSIYNAVDLEEMAITTPVKTPEPSMPEGNIPTDPGALIPSVPDTPVDSITPSAPIAPIKPIKPSEPAISNSPSLSVTDMLGWVHIGVFCVALTGITVVYILNHYRLFKAKTVTPPMQEVVRQSGFADNTRFCSLSGHRSVMLFGIFRPTVILPEGYTPDSEQEFGYILAHEREHFRNKDNLWQVLMLAALCLHWFNPIVWLVYRLFLADIEAACDERVLDRLSVTDKQDYANVVLNVAGRYHHSKPLMAMGFAKVRLKDRIKWIVNHKKVGITAGILSVVLFLAVAVVLGTGAMNNEDTESVDKTDASTPTSQTTTYPTAVQPIWGSDISATPVPIVFSDALVTGDVLTVETETIDLRGAGNGDYSSHIAVVQTFDEFKTLYNSDVEHDAIQKDKQYINNYNADFFKDHSLIVLCMNKSSISLKHSIDRVYLCGQHLYINMSSLDEKNTAQLMAGARFRTFITVKKAEFKDATNIVVYNKSVKTLPTEENKTTATTTRPLEVLTYENVTWKEVPIEKKSGWVHLTDMVFNLGSCISSTDYAFSGTVIAMKEYESYSTDESGKVWEPGTHSIIEVKVDQIYYGQLPIKGDTIKLYYLLDFSRDFQDSVVIEEQEEYVFMTSSVSGYLEHNPAVAQFTDAHISAAYYWDVFPIENGDVLVYDRYFDWNQDIMKKAKPDIETDRISSGKTGGKYMVLDKKDFDVAFSQLLNHREILLPMNSLLPYETAEKIAEDYIELKKEEAKKDKNYEVYNNYSINKVRIDSYFGTYNGCVALMITDHFTAYDINTHTYQIGKTKFTCENGLVVSFYKNGQFKNVVEAFDAKWITETDVKEILKIMKKWEPNISPDYTPNPLNPEKLTEAVVKRIKMDWANSKTEFIRLEDIAINQYLGRYDGAIALKITDNKTYYDQAVHRERIAGYDFTFNSGQRIMVYHDGKFVRLETAYGLSWIDKSDVRDILWHYCGK